MSIILAITIMLLIFVMFYSAILFYLVKLQSKENNMLVYEIKRLRSIIESNYKSL